ncbi:alpha/beta hydrolase [Sedimentitalea sp. JM2-8]|uniref:Alpha/beta hydrolase n=1 Tax=Sedimentitalea xiamensis TaxID=3050037 RepID=A0ABT7F9U5_9RHOB|nr:alpha/beta hydrolase [Sedimentitalea xiamensis]MDK3071856.1 alpha/beta hydrolase [Sedimentitalea xiamensis]
MPILRVNAERETCTLHGSAQPLTGAFLRAADTGGPIIIMIHGFSYQPHHPIHCPHRHILSLRPQSRPWLPPSWPRGLGFGDNAPDEGLGVAFGWPARGSLWQARRRAAGAGRALARLVTMLRRHAPDRRVHVVAHSMGTEVVAEGLLHMPAGSVHRIISLTGACYQSRMSEALSAPAGRTAEFLNVTSRENHLFDCLFERLVKPPRRLDRAIGRGLDAPNAVTLQLDCPDTLAHLSKIGAVIAPPSRRVCHWSTYTRPGVLEFYRDLLRHPVPLPLTRLVTGEPGQAAPRRSRPFGFPSASLPLPFAQKAT